MFSLQAYHLDFVTSISTFARLAKRQKLELQKIRALSCQVTVQMKTMPQTSFLNPLVRTISVDLTMVFCTASLKSLMLMGEGATGLLDGEIY